MTVQVEDLLELVQREAMIPPERMRPDATLEELGVESLDVISILFAIEDRYGIEIDTDELAEIPTLAGLVDFLSSRIANAPA